MSLLVIHNFTLWVIDFELKITVGVGNQGSTFQANSIGIQLQRILVKHANRDGWQWGGFGVGILSTAPLSLPHPHPLSALFSGKLSSPCWGPTGYPWVPAPPQYEFSFFFFFHSFLLNYMKQKIFIGMKIIYLLANQFATNQFNY